MIINKELYQKLVGYLEEYISIGKNDLMNEDQFDTEQLKDIKRELKEAEKILKEAGKHL